MADFGSAGRLSDNILGQRATLTPSCLRWQTKFKPRLATEYTMRVCGQFSVWPSITNPTRRTPTDVSLLAE
ncbi:hypothetical protein J6590_050665 [Homalodisca vitripennis]|nr:hypothetical protein J6590_050665 [Homalodisca vitripennis]